tara:strand:+ start:299 stop:739 length:441 start_codon:yes stop_codon:yes gene_type:complete
VKKQLTKMKLQTIISLLFLLLLSACNSTGQYSHQKLNDNGYGYKSDSDHKKPLTNDTALLISLLKRPTPADQILMEQFAQTQAITLKNAFGEAKTAQVPRVGYVMIKGERTSTQRTASQPEKAPHHLDALYQAYDTQFVRLTGPVE